LHLPIFLPATPCGLNTNIVILRYSDIMGITKSSLCSPGLYLKIIAADFFAQW
jgi:hypothetical protein